MLFGKQKVRVSDRLETVVGQNADFNGHLRCEGNLRIDGRCQGVVEATGNIVIGEMGQIEAEVRAKNVSVSGSVKGTIYANRVDLLSTGRIYGDVMVDSFFLDEGGYIHGQVNMRKETEGRPSAALPVGGDQATPGA